MDEEITLEPEQVASLAEEFNDWLKDAQTSDKSDCQWSMNEDGLTLKGVISEFENTKWLKKIIEEFFYPRRIELDGSLIYAPPGNNPPLSSYVCYGVNGTWVNCTNDFYGLINDATIDQRAVIDESRKLVLESDLGEETEKRLDKLENIIMLETPFHEKLSGLSTDAIRIYRKVAALLNNKSYEQLSAYKDLLKIEYNANNGNVSAEESE